MGISVSSETVPFKVVAWQGDLGSCDPNPDTGVVILDTFLREVYGEESDGNATPGSDYNGWVVPDPPWERYGQVCGDVLVKDGKKIFAINEDQYSSVGGITITFFSDDEQSLRGFISDWGIGSGITHGEVEVNRPVLRFS